MHVLLIHPLLGQLNGLTEMTNLSDCLGTLYLQRFRAFVQPNRPKAKAVNGDINCGIFCKALSGIAIC